MRTRQSKLCFLLFAVAFSLITLCIVAQAQVDPDTSRGQPTFHDDTWHVDVSPYLWLAGMNGTVSLGGHQAQVNQSFSQIFDNLKFGVMGLSEVRRGRIGILTDLMYIRLGDEQAVPIAGLPNALQVKTSLNTFTLTPYLGYRILGNQRGAIDVLFGGRYYHMGSKITATTSSAGSLSFSQSDSSKVRGFS